MNTLRLSTWILVISICFLSTSLWADQPVNNQAKKVVVYFDSYTPDMSWVQGIQKAINRGFGLKVIDKDGKEKDNPDAKYVVRNEHLNAKFYYEGPYFETLKDIMIKRYREREKPVIPDLILASDDWAVAFLLQYRNQIFPAEPPVPVVFCGVNERVIEFPAITTRDKKVEDAMRADRKGLAAIRFAGFFEKPGAIEMFNLIRAIHPNCRKIFVVNDGLEKTGKAWAKFVKDSWDQFVKEQDLATAEWEIDTEFSQKASLDQIYARIRSMNPQTDTVLLGAYFSDPQRSVESYEKTTDRICEVAKEKQIPVYGLLGFHREHGAWGGYELSGEGEGEAMVNRAVRILSVGNINASGQSSLWTIEDCAAKPTAAFNYKNFLPAQSFQRKMIYRYLKEHGEKRSMVEVGLAAPFGEWLETVAERTAKQPWFPVMVALVGWYVFIILGAYVRPGWIFRIYVFSEVPSQWARAPELVERIFGVSAYMVSTALVFPISMVKLRLARWWLSDNAENGRRLLLSNEKVSGALTPAPLKVPYIRHSSNGSRRSPGFDAGDFEETFRRKQTLLMISGRGGAGKSTLAWQLADAGLRRLSELPMVPTLIFGAGPEIKSEEVKGRIHEAMRSAITRFGESDSCLPDSWLRYLCKEGAVLCIVDGLSEMPEVFASALLDLVGTGEFPLNRVILTSRSIPKRFQGDRCSIDLLVNDSLTGFISEYLRRALEDQNVDRKKSVEAFIVREWGEAYSSATLQVIDAEITRQLGVKLANKYFGGFTDCRSTALFVKLRMECAIAGTPYRSLVAVASHFVSTCYQRLGDESQFLNAEESIAFFAQLAWGVISSRRKFRCDVLTKLEAANYTDEDVESEKLKEMLERFGLIEMVDETTQTFRFINDPIAEYLAPVAWSKLDYEARFDGWNALHDEAGKIPNDEILEMRGTVIGFYYFWLEMSESDREAWPWEIDLLKFEIRVETSRVSSIVDEFAEAGIGSKM